MSKRTLLIDGDTLVFEAAAATEYEAQWEPWLWTLHADFEAGMVRLADSLKEITEKLHADETVIALSDETRWRPAVMPLYKIGRAKTRKPVTYKALREYLHETANVYQRPTLEGDDVLGILATHPTLIPGEKIVVSIDKDMNTFPGLHIRYDHARGEEDWEKLIRHVTLAGADYYHLYQTLVGDKTDGYPGCPGVGPVGAEKLIGASSGLWDETGGFDVSDAWDVVVAAYQKKNLGEEVALQNARVARICRATDYDFEKKEVVLWNPPR